MGEQHLDREERVSPLELFFDLVFVFGFTQVTTSCPTTRPGVGFGHALLILSAVLPVALAVPALVALSLVAAVWVLLHAYELIWWRDARTETRAQRVSLT